MKNKKMKKIKEVIPLFLVTITLLSTVPHGSGINNYELEDKKNQEKPPDYFIWAFGACEKVLLDEKENAWGFLKGNLTIYNEQVFGSNENYLIFLRDSKWHLKQGLPEKFTLYGFSGWGKIKWVAFPHSPCTYFWLFGTAEYMETGS